jgi:2Fe-2S ferredoxin
MVKLVMTDREDRVVDIDAEQGISIMENIRDLDASVDAICGGMCACATCHVWIAPEWIGRLPPRSYEEEIMLQDSRYYDAERSRLSCQIRVSAELDGLAFVVAPEE